MRKILFLLLAALLTNFAIKAQVAINTDASAPDNSAMLDIKTTSKGFLLPRMTQAQRNAITNPATGLTIFIKTESLDYNNAGTPDVPAWTLTGSNASQWQNSGSNIYTIGVLLVLEQPLFKGISLL